MNMPLLNPIGRALQSALQPLSMSMRRVRPSRERRQVPPLVLERLEDRLLLDATLGTDPLVFDPTPGNASSGDEVTIGTITYTLTDADAITVNYSIAAGNQANYDLVEVKTTVNDGSPETQTSSGLPENTESFTHTLVLNTPFSADSIDIDACVTIDRRDVGAVGAALPSVGTVRVDTSGNITGLASYFDTVVTPGWIAKSSNIDTDTVTFESDPGWTTGEAVRVVQGYTSVPTNTGLVAPPSATDTTASATYYVRNLGPDINGDFVYSFHTSYNNALADIGKQDITAALPTNGELIITGENNALAFLGQTPINESVVPVATKFTLATTPFSDVSNFDGTAESISLVSTGSLASGTEVRVSAAFGGLSATTTYWARVLNATTVELYNSYANAMNAPAVTGRIGLSGTGPQVPPAGTTLNTVDPDNESVAFSSDPGWATGTGLRVNTTGGGLSAGTTYFVRSLGSGVYSFFDSAANATNTDADANPFNGRKDLTAAITASVFANLNTVSFENDHNWATGTVVRVIASGGGLTGGSNYFVRAVDSDTISLHTTLANAQGNFSPVTFSAPVVALLTPMFDGWCVDNDRFIAGNEYITNIYSSYDLGSFSNTSDDPKDSHLTEGGIAPVNTSMVPAATNATTDQVTFTSNHGWVTQQAVQVTATDDSLIAGTTYYVRVINGSTVSFHPTAAAASNAGPVAASTSFANVGVTPTATSTTAETVTYATDPGWADATLVRATATGGGLTAGTNYYVHNFTAGVYSFYTNPADATAGGTTGRINLTAAITAQVYTVTLASTEDTVTFNPGHGFATGDIVTPTGSGGGLTGGTAYALFNVSGDTFSFHTANPTADNKVNLTASITTNINERVDLTAALSASSVVFRTQSIDFAVNTEWPNGSPVRVSVADGGLAVGTTYFARAQSIVDGAADNNSISLYNTRENAVAGGATGLITFSDPIETITFTTGPAVVATDTTSETIDLSVSVSWVDGDAVQVSASGAGVTAGVNYYVRKIDADTISLFTSAANAQGFDNVGRVNLTVALAPTTTVNPVDSGDTTQTVFYVPENLVEYPENLDVMNWVLNQKYPLQLADGRAPTATNTSDAMFFVPASTDFNTSETVMFGADPNWATATPVNVSATGGGLNSLSTYYVRNMGGGEYSFYNSAVNASAGTATGRVNLVADITAGVYAELTNNTVTVPVYGWTTGLKVQVSVTGGGLMSGTDYYIRALNTTTIGFYATAADATNNVNRIDLTGDIQVALVRPYYTEGDVQRTVWELIENTPGDPGNWSPLRVAEILAEADAAVGLNETSVDFVPDCDGSVAIILMPFQVNGPSNEQLTVAQITIAQIPNYCLEGSNCQSLSLNLGSISGVKFADMDGDGVKETEDTVLPGWTVYLDANDNATLDEGESFAVTGPNGAYAFSGLLPGRYIVREVQQPAWTQTKDVGEVTVGLSVDDAAAPVLANQDFGNFELIDISGVKVHDIDYDGRQGGISDAGDLRLANLRVYLDTIANDRFDYTDANANGQFDAGDTALERYTLTDANGAFAFTNLGPGTYDVREDLSSLDSDEWQPTASLPAPVIAASGTDVTGIDFYNAKYPGFEYGSYTIGGYQGKGAPGQYLLENFATLQSGVVVPRATVSDIVLSDATLVQSFLSATNSKPFTGGGATRYIPSTLEKQFVALTLNIGLDLGNSTSRFGDLVLGDLTGNFVVANGLTISQFKQQVYDYLDGDLSAGDGDSAYTLGLNAGDLTNLTGNLNLSFDNGKPTPWAERYLG